MRTGARGFKAFMMDEKELARAAAADLGPDVIAAVEKPVADDEVRGLPVSDAMAIGGFLVSCAQLTWQIWNARQERALLVEALTNSEKLMTMYPRLDPEKRLGLIARVLAKLLPDTFGRPTHATSAEKRHWVKDYQATRTESGGPEREPVRGEYQGGGLILMPFADEDWWILLQNVGWVPDASDGPGVVRVDVPKGFVTDLASVPSYLWPILAKTGRYGNAAVYHDWLYWDQAITREVADRVFDRAMHDMGVDAITRRLMWAGVRVFGGSCWQENAGAKAAGARRVLKKYPDLPTVTWEDWRRKTDVFQ